MGSAALYHLAVRGVRAIGIDRYVPPHNFGSTHGLSRITRQAIYEHPLYVPLVQRANALRIALEDETGERLFHRTGGLMIGGEHGVLVSGARRSAETHGLAHELLDGDEIRRRFPAYAPPSPAIALFEPDAGLLLPERIVGTQLSLAAAHGAELRLGTTVTRWSAEGAGVRIETDDGVIRAGQVILAAGSWLPALCPDLDLPLTVERQLFHWFQPQSASDIHSAEECPLSLWEYARDRIFATFPDLGDGVKCGVHHEGATVLDPDRVSRTVRPAEDLRIRTLLAALQPTAAGSIRDARVCLYTNTPDHHFLIDRHPVHPQVILASPCSGHGFKFAMAIGELLADMAVQETPRFDITAFGLARFAWPPVSVSR